MNIVQITESDLEEIIQIETKIYPKPWSRFHFQIEISKPPATLNLCAITDEGKIIAYLFGEVQNETFHLTNIAVHPDFRRKKIALKILDYLSGKLDVLNIRVITLAMKKENEPARKLFLSRRFKEINKNKDYFTKGDDAIVLTLEITPNG